MKRAIISLATKRGNYYKGLCRLGESLRGNFSGDFLGFMGEGSVGAPKHEEVPYGFKVYAFEHAYKLGYEQVLWLDSSVYAIRDVQPAFDIIDQYGCLFQESGFFLGQYANDKCLAFYNMTRDYAMNIPMSGNAGLLGLNFGDRCGNNFVNRWRTAMEHGIFNGSWNNDRQTESKDQRCLGHRHDMSCSTVIRWEAKAHLIPGNEILQYAAPTDTPQNDTICLFAQGL